MADLRLEHIAGFGRAELMVVHEVAVHRWDVLVWAAVFEDTLAGMGVCHYVAVVSGTCDDRWYPDVPD